RAARALGDRAQILPRAAVSHVAKRLAAAAPADQGSPARAPESGRAVNRSNAGRLGHVPVNSVGASNELGAHPPLEGEGRERSERGGVNFSERVFTPPGRLATARRRPSPSRGG